MECKSDVATKQHSPFPTTMRGNHLEGERVDGQADKREREVRKDICVKTSCPLPVWRQKEERLVQCPLPEGFWSEFEFKTVRYRAVKNCFFLCDHNTNLATGRSKDTLFKVNHNLFWQFVSSISEATKYRVQMLII